MKRLVVFPFVVLVAGLALSVRAAQNPDAAPRHPKQTKKMIHISGTVGTEGKTLVSLADKRVWNVLNPVALSASEGRRVIVKARPGSDPTQISILDVRLEPETTARLSDSAFRR